MTHLDGVYAEVGAAVVVHDGHVVVADVLALLVAGGVALAAGHGRGHVEVHLHHVVVPHVRVEAVLAALLQVEEQAGLGLRLQFHQRAQLAHELHVPAAEGAGERAAGGGRGAAVPDGTSSSPHAAVLVLQYQDLVVLLAGPHVQHPHLRTQSILTTVSHALVSTRGQSLDGDASGKRPRGQRHTYIYEYNVYSVILILYFILYTFCIYR